MLCAPNQFHDELKLEEETQRTVRGSRCFVPPTNFIMQVTFEVPHVCSCPNASGRHNSIVCIDIAHLLETPKATGNDHEGATVLSQTGRRRWRSGSSSQIRSQDTESTGGDERVERLLANLLPARRQIRGVVVPPYALEIAAQVDDLRVDCTDSVCPQSECFST